MSPQILQSGYYDAVAAGQFVDSGYYPERNGDGSGLRPRCGLRSWRQRPRCGQPFSLNYSALLAVMTSQYVEKRTLTG